MLDMGILRTFMFLRNMVGALVLIAALSRFLLNHQGRSRRRALRRWPGSDVHDEAGMPRAVVNRSEGACVASG